MPSTRSHQSSSIAVGLARTNKAARQKIRKGRNRAVIRKALREKYACGTISPNNVITTAREEERTKSCENHIRWCRRCPRSQERAVDWSSFAGQGRAPH